MRAVNLIGTKKESSLHAALKCRYAGEEGLTELAVGQYVCDAVSKDGTYIEIQTGSFKPLINKVKAITALGPLKIVHPVARKRIIEVRDDKGLLIRRRTSPKKGSAWDLFSALIFAPTLPLTQLLTIEVALTEELELRKADGLGSWRRKGVSVHGRELCSILEIIHLSSPQDYLQFVPFEKSEIFGANDLAKKVQISKALARKALYVLSRIAVVQEIGKKGNAKQYSLQ